MYPNQNIPKNYVKTYPKKHTKIKITKCYLENAYSWHIYDNIFQFKIKPVDFNQYPIWNINLSSFFLSQIDTMKTILHYRWSYRCRVRRIRSSARPYQEKLGQSKWIISAFNCWFPSWDFGKTLQDRGKGNAFSLNSSVDDLERNILKTLQETEKIFIDPLIYSINTYTSNRFTQLQIKAALLSP